MRSSRLHAFTLIELIVVMAIIVTLSVIGFISYNSYIRDARNATRDSQLNEAVAGIDRFVFNNARAPKCRGASGVINGPAVCYLTPDSGSGVSTPAKGTAFNTVTANVYVPSNGTTKYGIDSADWTQLNLKSNPEDPRNVYYVYATDGNSAYAIFATREESAGYSTMVKGFKAMPWDSANPTTDAIKTALWPATASTVRGFTTPGGNFQTTTSSALLGDKNLSATVGQEAPVPYTW